MIINAKRAVMFVGFMRGKGRCGARFSSCDGYIKRVIKLKENRTYHFVLKSELTKGTLSVEVQDSRKHTLIHLENNVRNASIEVDKKKRYYLVFEFQSATGNFELEWN